jgi:hypothetical protein
VLDIDATTALLGTPPHWTLHLRDVMQRMTP